MASGAKSREQPVMDIIVEEIVNLSFFWAQIGTASHFSEFEKQISEMSRWCESSSSGSYKDSSLLSVEQIVAFKEEGEKENGSWIRGKVIRIVSESAVELFLVDMGRVCVVDVHQICTTPPQIMLEIPQQALHCVLDGVKQLPDDGSGWSLEAVSVFRSLVVAPTKAVVHKVIDGKRVLVSIFSPFEGRYTSVGEIMKRKNLVKYDSSSSVTLDLPVPPKLVEASVLEAEVSKVERTAQAVLPVGPILSQTYFDGTDDHESSISLDNSLEFNDEDEDGISTCIPDLEDSVTAEEGEVSQTDGVPATAPIMNVEAVPLEQPNTPADTPTPPDKLGGSVEQGSVSAVDGPVAASAGPVMNNVSAKLVVVMPEGSSSSSVVKEEWSVNSGGKQPASVNSRASAFKEEISKVTSRPRTKQEKQFLQDLLGGEGSSSSLSDSDWKDERFLPQVSESSSMEVVKCAPTNVPPRCSTSSSAETVPTQALKSGNFQMAAYDAQAGNTPHPMKKFSAYAHSDPLSVKFQAFHRRFQDDGFGSERPHRGRGGVINKDGATSRRRKEFARPFDREKGSGGKRGRGRGYQLHGSRRQLDFPVPPAVEYSELEKEQNGQPVHPLPSHAPAPPPTLDEPVAPVQVPATEVLAVTDSEAYCSKIEGMSKTEVDEEAKWQIWKFEKEIGKVVNGLNAGSVGNFSKEVDQLLIGPIAQKLSDLPDCTPPLEVIVVFIVREGAMGTLNVNLVVRALDLLMEGPCGDGVCQVIEKSMCKMASDVLECGLDEGKKMCCGLSQFVGLLLNGSVSRKAKHTDIIISAIKKVFHIWANFLGLDAGEHSKNIQVFCYGFLLDTVSSCMSLFKETLAELADGPVRSSILCRGYTETLRGTWLSNAYKTLRCVNSISDSQRVPPGGEELLTETADVRDKQSSSGGASPCMIASKLETVEEKVVTQHYDGVPSEKMVNHSGPCSNPSPAPQSHSQPTMYSPALPEQFVFPVRPYTPPDPDPHSPTLSSSPVFNSPSETTEVADLYARVSSMLESLQLTEILPKFKASLIKDSILNYDLVQIKSCLKDAGIPPGAILEVSNYLSHSVRPVQQQKSQVSGKSPQQPLGQHQIRQFPQQPTYASSLQAHSTLPQPMTGSAPTAKHAPYSYQLQQVPQQQIQSQQQNHQQVQQHQQHNHQVLHHQQQIQHQQPHLHRQRSQDHLYPQQIQTQQQHSARSSPLLERNSSQMSSSLPLNGSNSNHQFEHQQMLHPSTNGHEATVTRRNIGLPSTGQRIVHTSVAPSNPSVTSPAPDSKPVPTSAYPPPPCVPASPLPMPPENRKAAPPPPPPQNPGAPAMLGFGVISCVICGGKDHATYTCGQRDKRFTHM